MKDVFKIFVVTHITLSSLYSISPNVNHFCVSHRNNLFVFAGARAGIGVGCSLAVIGVILVVVITVKLKTRNSKYPTL